jgi:hypothetical protein
LYSKKICAILKFTIEKGDEMSNELKRTYVPFKDWKEKSKQIEYTEKTPLLSPDGKLLAKGWARRNVFEYNRDYVKKGIISRKEWDFYTITDGRMQLLVSFANINIGGYVGCKLTDLQTGEIIADAVSYFAGGNKHVPPAKGDVPNRFKEKIGKAEVLKLVMSECEIDFNHYPHSAEYILALREKVNKMLKELK